MPCRPARFPGKCPLQSPQAPPRVALSRCSPRAAGPAAVLRPAAGASGLGAGFQRRRLPMRRRRGRRRARSAARACIPTGASPSPGRAQNAAPGGARAACFSPLLSDFRGRPPAGPFERALGAHRPFKVLRSRLFGDMPRSPGGAAFETSWLFAFFRLRPRRMPCAGMRGQPRPLHYAPAACAATAATQALGPPRRAASASLKSAGRGVVGGGRGGPARPPAACPATADARRRRTAPAGWRHAAPRPLRPLPRAAPARPCPHRPAAAIRADIAKTPRGLLRSA